MTLTINSSSVRFTFLHPYHHYHVYYRCYLWARSKTHNFKPLWNSPYIYTHLESGQILDKVVGGLVHELKELILLRVLVLVQEALDLVHHSAGIVQDAKLFLPVATVGALDVVRVLFQQLMLLHQVWFVCALWVRQLCQGQSAEQLRLQLHSLWVNLPSHICAPSSGKTHLCYASQSCQGQPQGQSPRNIAAIVTDCYVGSRSGTPVTCLITCNLSIPCITVMSRSTSRSVNSKKKNMVRKGKG